MSKSKKLLILSLTAILYSCSGGSEDAPKKEVKKIVESEKLSSIDSLSKFKIETFVDKDLALDPELESVFDRIAEIKKSEFEEISKLEKDLSFTNKKILNLKDIINRTTTNTEEKRKELTLKSVEAGVKVSDLLISKIDRKREVDRLISHLNRYQVELSEELAKIEEDRGWVSGSLNWIGFDTLKDEKEEKTKEIAAKYEVDSKKSLLKKAEIELAKADTQLSEAEDEKKFYELELKHLLEENKTITDVKTRELTEANTELLELNTKKRDLEAAYADLLKNLDPQSRLAIKLSDFFKRRKSLYIRDQVNLSSLIDLFIEKHYLYYLAKNIDSSLKLEDLRTKINSLVFELEDTTLIERKEIYEGSIESDLGLNLIYNKENATIVDIFEKGKIQCFSGTSLFLILNLLADSERNDLVVIQHRGHILPGYVKIENGKRKLYGFESTASGRALISYGHTASIYGDIRVLDAKQYLAFALLSYDVKDIEDSFDNLLSYSKEQFGIKIEDQAPLRSNLKEIVEDHHFKFSINTTPLVIGSSDQRDGDISREPIDSLDKSSVYQRKNTSGVDGGSFRGDTFEVQYNHYQGVIYRPAQVSQSGEKSAETIRVITPNTIEVHRALNGIRESQIFAITRSHDGSIRYSHLLHGSRCQKSDIDSSELSKDIFIFENGNKIYQRSEVDGNISTIELGERANEEAFYRILSLPEGC